MFSTLFSSFEQYLNADLCTIDLYYVEPKDAIIPCNLTPWLEKLCDPTEDEFPW